MEFVHDREREMSQPQLGGEIAGRASKEPAQPRHAADAATHAADAWSFGTSQASILMPPGSRT